MPQAYGNLGMSGTLQGCEVLERRTIHTPGLHMHRQGAMTPTAILRMHRQALPQPTFSNSKQRDIYRVNVFSKQIL